MLVDTDAAGLDAALRELGRETADGIVADVSDAAQVRGYVARCIERFGRLDVLFSNAGNVGGHYPIAQFPEEQFDRVIAVHVRGAFLACKYGLPAMSDGGSIIITSSIAGLRAGGGGSAAYATAKHAQVGLMRNVAKEAAPRRIRVNTLHPGPIDNAFQLEVETNMGRLSGRDATAMLNEAIPLKRHARADEVARSALYLASDLSSFTTGTTLAVDGGLSA